MSSDSGLQDRIESRDATVSVVGLGYVGLPVSIAFAEAGFTVNGFDIDTHRVQRLRKADSYVDDVENERLAEAVAGGFNPTSEPRGVADADVYILAVPTGIADDEPDMSAVESAAATVAAQSGDRETLVVVSSTVYPGATREVVEPVVGGARSIPTRFAMVPERLNPGGEYEFGEIPLVVGADTDPARVAATALFDTVVNETHPVDSTETAELTKTLENTYRMVNIALVNELIKLAEGVQADVWEAIEAAATKPFGFQPFQPGPGVGGHCIPVDPQFLSWRATDIGTEVSFIDDAHQVNEEMPALVADRVEMLLRARGADINAASVVALGASYKPNVGDTRNSPALRVVERLPTGIDVTVVDPHVDSESVARQVARSSEEADIEGADAVVLLVNHDEFDLDEIGERADCVFDTRNAMPSGTRADIIKLGEMVDTVDTDAVLPTQ